MAIAHAILYYLIHSKVETPYAVGNAEEAAEPVISQDNMGNQGKTRKRVEWGGWGSKRSQMGGFKYCNES